MTKSLIIGHFDPLTTSNQQYIEFLNQYYDHPDILLLSKSKRIQGIYNLYAVKNTFVKNQVYWRDCIDDVLNHEYIKETIRIVIGKSYDKIFELDTEFGFELSPLKNRNIYEDISGFWSLISKEYQKLLNRRVAVIGNYSAVDCLFYETNPYIDLKSMSEQQKIYFQINNYQTPLAFCDFNAQMILSNIHNNIDLYVFLEDQDNYDELKNYLLDKNCNFITINVRNMDLFTCVNTIKNKVNTVSRELKWF